MDKYGIWAAVLYPNVAGFGAGKMLTIGDGELMLACVRAYNDFLAEYSSVAPDRFIPIMALPFWDLDETEQEIARAAGLGHKGVIMTGEPFFWGMPKLADPHWDRLWAVCQDAGLSVNFHIGSGDMSIFDRAYEGAGEHANYAGFGVQFGIANVVGDRQPHHRRRVPPLPGPQVRVRRERRRLAAVRPRAPRLAVAELRRAHRSTRSTTCCPREYFKRQMYGCFWFETDSVKAAIDQMGPDCFLYESDFPHPTSMAPGPAIVGRRTPPVHRRGARRPPRGRPARPCSTTTRPSSTTSTDARSGRVPSQIWARHAPGRDDSRPDVRLDPLGRTSVLSGRQQLGRGCGEPFLLRRHLAARRPQLVGPDRHVLEPVVA